MSHVKDPYHSLPPPEESMKKQKKTMYFLILYKIWEEKSNKNFVL